MARPSRSLHDRFFEKVDRVPSGCWLWTASKLTSGYGMIRVKKDDHWVYSVAHRVSWELHCSPIPDGLFALHKCDVRACVNPDHLYIGTAKNNTADMMNRGRGNPGKGERHGRAKMTDELVRKIRIDPRTTRAIGKDLGICGQAVAKIKLGRTWAHVKENCHR